MARFRFASHFSQLVNQPLIWALVVSMVRLLFLFSVFIQGCSSYVELDPNDHLIGKWSLTEQGKDFENIKECEFLTFGKLNCTHSEAGFSNGYGDAHIYKTSGDWSIQSNTLTLTEIPTDNLKQKLSYKYNFKSFTADKMVLINNKGATQVWLKTN